MTYFVIVFAKDKIKLKICLRVSLLAFYQIDHGAVIEGLFVVLASVHRTSRYFSSWIYYYIYAMDRQLEQLTALLTKQAEMATSAQEEAKKREDEAQRREERLASMLEDLVSARRTERTDSGAGGGSVTRTSDPPPRHKIPSSAALAPHLSSSASLKEFDDWRHKVEGYVMLTGISSLTPAEQRSALISLLDDDWTRTLRYGLNLSDSADLKCTLDAMETHLRSQRNIILDRRDFYLRSQESGEAFDDFLCSIKEIAAFCDFCASCMDNRLRDRIVVGIRDEEALKRMLEEKNLTLQKAIDICRNCTTYHSL